MTQNARIRFADNNLAASSAATVTASSAQAAYPIANLTNSFRFKTWKPAGNFTISSANNKIYIGDGSNKTVTLSSANYTYATLATHIQTQLNASSSNWTVSYSTTTFKFTIGRSSGTATLRFTQTTGAAWDTLGYTGVADTSAGTGLAADEVRNHTSEYVDIDLGVASAQTFFAALGPLGEVFSVSDTATVHLYGNTTSDMTSPALSVTLTPDTHGIYKWIDDNADTTYRYWRFQFVDRLNSAGPLSFNFGHLYLGDHTTVTTQNVGTGVDVKLVDTAEEVTSETGACFYSTGYKFQTFDSVSIDYLTASEVSELKQAFYDLGRSSAFYVSFDPTLAVSETLSDLTRYVVFSGDPSFTHIMAGMYSVRMAFKEVG